MAAKKASGWSSSLRQSFNLVPETETAPAEDPFVAEAQAAPPPAREDVSPAPVAPQPTAQTTDFVPLTSAAATPQRGPGRPKATVERFPKTIYLTTSAELALRRAVEQIQDWRGRQRGIPKAQESDATNIALEYLYRRMLHGPDAAEDFFRDYQSAERSRSQDRQQPS